MKIRKIRKSAKQKLMILHNFGVIMEISSESIHLNDTRNLLLGFYSVYLETF